MSGFIPTSQAAPQAGPKGGQGDNAQLGRSFITVSQLTTKVKGLLENQVGEVWVKGEISGFKPSSAGHLYFSLKDEFAVLNCAMFRGAASKIANGASKGEMRVQIRDGVEVIAHGKISVYAPRGNYQLIVDYVEPVGAGALQLAFEQLKKKLEKEGLFALARKRPLPEYPTKVAIITSPTGAALQDMLNVLGRRNSGISILVVPTLVQGDDAPPQIARAVEVVNQHRLADVIVVARGGGSMEDLWCFNDERVVRAVAASGIPVISAVGHEVDFTLCDFTADLRAPTPSAAAELVSKNRLELIEGLLSTHRRLQFTVSAKLQKIRAELLGVENRLISPTERLLRVRKVLEELELRMAHAVDGLLPQYRQMLDELLVRLNHTAERAIQDRRRQFENLSGRLEALSPLKVLGRGYTLIEAVGSDSNHIIKSVQDATQGKEIKIIFHDGKALARIH